jgi:hypothetical protein
MKDAKATGVDDACCLCFTIGSRPDRVIPQRELMHKLMAVIGAETV